ncbi:hypothetical protein [Azospirillum picis]|uniref:Phage tail protein n=1 Tax=Azospirillum picis TaxID=488438 RepID=A0ABU0MP81_9PROT|nr:hypothetical protein [Azospirillum picis]MBP2301313.1 hypothetical protein [Azospirillum picis]MDQ0535144.1 hypothetical protein [Azospirillum picis]
MTEEIAWIAEFDYQRPSGVAETLHLSRGAVRPMPASDPDRPNQKYRNRLVEVPSYQTRALSDPSTLGGSIGTGNLTVSNADGALSYLRDCRPVAVRVWRGVSGRPLVAWRQIAAARPGPLRWEIGSGDQAGRVSIPILDARADLEDAILDATYAGTNSGATGYEGEVGGIKGQTKPIALGDLTDAHVPGVWVNQPASVAQLHDGADAGPMAAVTAIWDRGGNAQLTALSDRTGSAFDTAALTSTQYVTDLVRGYCRIGGTLGAQPTFGLRGAAAAGDTAPSILRWLLTRRGHGTRIGASLAAWAAPAKVGVWLEQPSSYREAWDPIAASAAAWVLPDATGQWQVGTLAAPLGAPVLSLSERKIKELSVADATIAQPVWKVTVRWGRIYRTFARNDLAAVVIGTAAETRLAEEWRSAVAKSQAVKTLWGDQAREITIDTALRSEADAEALAAQLLALFGPRPDGSPRQLLRVATEMTDPLLDLAHGQEVALSYPLEGLTGSWAVWGKRPAAPDDHLIELELFG